MKKIKLVADLHVHTVASGHAYSTIEEYAARAKEIGLEAMAVTDHGPAMPGGAPLYHFSNMRMIPERIGGVRIYRGAEVNIVGEDGSLDIPDEVLAGLDIVIVAMHPRVGYESRDEEKNTEVLLRALRNPHINIIAHPGNPMYPVSVRPVVAAAKERGIAIEINNSSFTGSRTGSWDRCLSFAREVKEAGHFAVVGSDSHISMMLGGFDKAQELVSAAGLPQEMVLNSSIDLIEKRLIRRK